LTSPSAAQICESLDRLQCETSPDCMSVKEPDSKTSVYACVPAANACQIDFQQIRTVYLDGVVEDDPAYDRTAACQSTEGCRLVLEGTCYCPPFEHIDCICGGGTPSDCVPES
jgi:hypothetical protein